jgi:hypothetical protein
LKAKTVNKMESSNLPMIEVPDEMVADLSSIIGKTDQLSQVIAASLEAGWHIGNVSITRAIASKVKIPVTAVRDLLLPLIGLFQLKNNLGRSSQETLKIILQKLRTSNEEERKLVANQLETNLQRLEHVLDQLNADHPLVIASKAFDLATSHQYELVGMRVFTDIRPVFNEEGDTILQSIITHVLSLDYHENETHHVIQFSLDAIDIKNLKEMLIRAEKKGMTIKRDLKSLAWPTTVFREQIDPKE